MFKTVKIKAALWLLDGMMKDGNNARKTAVFWKVGKLLKEKDNMETLAKVRTFLQGKKTYLLCAQAIIGAIVGWQAGVITEVEAIKMIWEALTISTVRAGVSGMVSK